MPSARFRTRPWNGEFFRQGCLAVGCRCFAPLGAEKKDADEQNQNASEQVLKATNIEPSAKMRQRSTKITTPNQYRKRVEKGRERNGSPTQRLYSNLIQHIAKPTTHHPTIHSQIDFEEHENNQNAFNMDSKSVPLSFEENSHEDIFSTVFRCKVLLLIQLLSREEALPLQLLSQKEALPIQLLRREEEWRTVPDYHMRTNFKM